MLNPNTVNGTVSGTKRGLADLSVHSCLWRRLTTIYVAELARPAHPPKDHGFSYFAKGADTLARNLRHFLREPLSEIAIAREVNSPESSDVYTRYESYCQKKMSEVSC